MTKGVMNSNRSSLGTQVLGGVDCRKRMWDRRPTIVARGSIVLDLAEAHQLVPADALPSRAESCRISIASRGSMIMRRRESRAPLTARRWSRRWR